MNTETRIKTKDATHTLGKRVLTRSSLLIQCHFHHNMYGMSDICEVMCVGMCGAK